MNFSDNLIKLRKTKGWSQEDLADKLSLSRQAISKWEVGTSKPDIDNLINLSKLFKVSIDQLVNNEIIVTEAVSFDVKKNDKKKKVLTLLKRLFIVLAIIYVVNVIYNFAVLFTITQAELKYKGLDNYHYIITTYDNEGLREKEECWFKDGVSKTSNIIYKNGEKQETITCIDYNKNNAYLYNLNLKETKKFNLSEYLLLNENFNNGQQLYSRFPNKIINGDFYKSLTLSINNELVKVNYLNKYIFLNFKNTNIALEKETLLPQTYYYENKDTGKFTTIEYYIDLNSIDELKI